MNLKAEHCNHEEYRCQRWGLCLVLAPSFISCVTLSQFFSLSQRQFSHQGEKDEDTTYPTELLSIKGDIKHSSWHLELIQEEISLHMAARSVTPICQHTFKPTKFEISC